MSSVDQPDALGLDEIDVAAAPLPYTDDRKRFEGALSRIPGVKDVRIVSTQGPTHRVRVVYRGDVPLVERLRALREYRVRVLAESPRVVQLLLEPAR